MWSNIADLHFLHPLWLLTLIPLALLLWRLSRLLGADSAWRKICDAPLLRYLLNEQSATGRRLPLWLLAAGVLLAVLALADPTWEKQPQPLVQTLDARVIVLDLSRSMLTPDLKPSRLARARFKVADLLKRNTEGQTGLVAFAGDAFVVSPLTQDAATIQSQLAALEPDIMPVQGSRADLGLRQAGVLLRQAGLSHGDVLLIADEVDSERDLAAVRALRDQGYTVSVLAVGTEQGAPLPDGRGGVVTDASGRPVIPRVDANAMRGLAQAGGGRFALLSVTDADLQTLAASHSPQLDSQIEKTDLTSEQWRERGPWLVVVLLPLASLAFRRGWLLVLPLSVAVSAFSVPEPALAFGWADLWQRQEQQAAHALAGGDNARAAELAQDPQRKGTAYYRNGNYQQALATFQGASGADADYHYNRANALAKLGRLEEALAAYDQALQQQPGMADAEHNKKLIEELLKQQEQDQQQAQQQQNQDQQQAEQQDQGQGQDQQQAEQQDQSQGQDQQQAEQQGQGQSQNQQQAEQQDQGQGQNQQQAEQQPSDEATPEEQPGLPAAADSSPSEGKPADDEPQQAVTTAEDFNAEEQRAVEQWLRRIPDDPGGLLRRKFLYQYRQRGATSTQYGGKTW